MTKPIARTAPFVLVAALVAAPVFAQSPQQLADDATRYMAMGDSLAAGFKAQPVTQGYAFRLYQTGVFDRMPHTLFNDIGVVGATSEDVLRHEVPLALIPAARGGFQAQYITLNVGGNDIAALRALAASNPPPDVLGGAVAAAVVAYRGNLQAILQQLTSQLPDVKIFVANQYTVPEIEALFPGAPDIVALFNAQTAAAVAEVPNAYLVDVHEAFLDRNGLLLIERRGASPLEVHLTNAGHRAMADAFAEVIEANK
jgi:lysophospholipase L1-like esterase